jgi:hypothetical protein
MMDDGWMKNVNNNNINHHDDDDDDDDDADDELVALVMRTWTHIAQSPHVRLCWKTSGRSGWLDGWMGSGRVPRTAVPRRCVRVRPVSLPACVSTHQPIDVPSESSESKKMDAHVARRISKTMSYLLRHGAAEARTCTCGSTEHDHGRDDSERRHHHHHHHHHHQRQHARRFRHHHLLHVVVVVIIIFFTLFSSSPSSSRCFRRRRRRHHHLLHVVFVVVVVIIIIILGIGIGIGIFFNM